MYTLDPYYVPGLVPLAGEGGTVSKIGQPHHHKERERQLLNE